jgi:uncharacterized damage-inducible protein DinB
MSISEGMVQELQYEAATTRKLLERVPEEQFGWKPHEKSMTLGHLASHLAETFEWAIMTLTSDGFDFDPATSKAFNATSRDELLAAFEKGLKEATAALQGASDEQLLQPWKLSAGGQTIFELPRVAVMRTWILNHAVHHRGQLSVYLRLLDVPVPSIYGPSADEQG